MSSRHPPGYIGSSIRCLETARKLALPINLFVESSYYCKILKQQPALGEKLGEKIVTHLNSTLSVLRGRFRH